MIKVEGLTKRYARNVAVDNISFEVGKGQIVGFLGPNGAGKTTTMRVLTCFLPPTSGTAEVAGYDVVQQPMEVKKRIGYLPETPPLYPDMEVAEYVEFVGKLKGMPTGDLAAKVADACERCHITDVRKKLIAKLSKGYKQRVGLAAAIVHNPDVLVLDEPTAGLDPEQRRETLSLIRQLAGDHTVILSTHILPEVEQTCEQVIIISKGQLKAIDTMANLDRRLRGAEIIQVEVEARQGTLGRDTVQQRLEQVAGVQRVTFREAKGQRLAFDVEGTSGQNIQPDLARTVVAADWNLVELHAAGLGLEEIYLQLTGAGAPANQGGAQ
ncbi:MAG: ABC transporter ATP-binding protein [Bryobacterales bacterium]|nr:ABC transporter ATP-binding protein [Bryobacterales bacterium]